MTSVLGQEYPPDDAHTEDPDDVLSMVDRENGLSSEDVEKIRAETGSNELTQDDPTSIWALIAEQFDDTLVQILLVSAVVSTLIALYENGGAKSISDFVEPIVILVILVLNAIVGVWQESNAEAALEALKDLQPSNARVLRDGTWTTVEATEVVVGDIVEVRKGDKIPADLRLIEMETATMRLDQSQLTGESVPVQKDTDPLNAKKDGHIIQEKVNMLFSTTTVSNGKGIGIVTHIGMTTEIGKMWESVQAAEAAKKEAEASTPLKQKLDAFGDQLALVIAVICGLVWAINWKNFFDKEWNFLPDKCIYYFNIAIALAVAAIPEGLPAVITTCLALGTRKMAKKNAIVRKLPSVETLGCTSVICSDKTGTLTTNEMTITTVVHMKNESTVKQYDVEGLSYDPNGHLVGMQSVTPALMDISRVCALCNESNIEWDDDAQRYLRIGEPTEAALKILVEKIGHPDVDTHDRESDPGAVVQAVNEHYMNSVKKVATLEFSRDRKSMSVLCGPADAAPKPASSGVSTRRTTRSQAAASKGGGSGGNVLYVKGAPEGIIERCSHMRLEDGTTVPFTAKAKAQLAKEQQKMAGDALRTLALAFKEDTGELSDYDGSHDHAAHEALKKYENYSDYESDMVFAGLVGMKDPPRDEVRGAIEKCKLAGIRVVVITGDNKKTAESVCRSIGVFGEDEDVEGKSFEGHAFFKLDEDEQREILGGKGGRVFSRTEPTHKQALVKILGELGYITAMTGDGVNDAPALKQADIGIAMGMAGTEVAKEASDMVLADDNFATIVEAVSEGRSIYNNMQAFIRYLISSNIGEVAAIFFTAALTIPEGLIPVQLLWVNLVTDGPPATALGFNPPDKDIMKKLPRSKDEELITPWVFVRYMIVGIYVGVACVGVFAFWYVYADSPYINDGHSAVTFTQLRDWNKCFDYYGPNVTVTPDQIPAHWQNFKPASFTTQVGDITWEPGNDPCSYFTDGKKKASTLSLSVLVMIEMLNALNALSEDGSLVTMPPWVNPYLILAMLVSFGMHAVILYIPWMAENFQVQPLTLNENLLVFLWSVPVIFIDEILKFIGRTRSAAELAKRMKDE